MGLPTSTGPVLQFWPREPRIRLYSGELTKAPPIPAPLSYGEMGAPMALPKPSTWALTSSVSAFPVRLVESELFAFG
jgi:hypothetical protein